MANRGIIDKRLQTLKGNDIKCDWLEIIKNNTS